MQGRFQLGVPWVRRNAIPFAIVLLIFNGAAALAQQESTLPTGQGRDLAISYRKATEETDRKAAITALHSLLGKLVAADDIMLADADGSVRSLKALCVEQLQKMSSADAGFYESQFGPEAKAKLEEARQTADIEALESVSRAFFFTTAGQQATRELALRALDRDQPLQAAMHLTRLRAEMRNPTDFTAALQLQLASAWARAGMDEEARRCVTELVQSGSKRITVADGTLNLTDSAAVSNWLTSSTPKVADSEWPIFLGDTTRTRQSAPVIPEWVPRWRYNTLQTAVIDGDAEDSAVVAGFRAVARELRILSESRRAFSMGRVPALNPLVVGDRVLFRSPLTMSAVRLRAEHGLKAGELEWETFEPDRHMWSAFRALRNGDRGEVREQVESWAFVDATTGSLSSDGRFVYAVEETERTAAGEAMARGGFVTSGSRPHNFLRAYEVDSGSVAWQIGGENGLPVAGIRNARFLGPPVPFGGDLLQLIATRDDIRLLQLHVENVSSFEPDVRVVWSQRLTRTDLDRGLAGGATLAGLSPSLAGNLLICPTGAGEIVAVDPASRRLVWKTAYPTSQSLAALGRGRTDWTDGVIRVVGDHVICTPRGTSRIFCLDQQSGKLQWIRPRNEAQCVSIANDIVIVSGPRLVAAYSVERGEPLWPDEFISLPNPTGRPIVHDGFFSVPLAGGLITTIDIKSGRQLATVKTGVELGNLVAVGDAFVSQSPSELIVFDGLATTHDRIRQRIASDANDDAALLARGIEHLQAGRFEPGIKDVAKAAKLNPAGDGSEVLFKAIHGLDADRFRIYSALLAPLVEDSPETWVPTSLANMGPLDALRMTTSHLNRSLAFRFRLLRLSPSQPLTANGAAEAIRDVVHHAEQAATFRVVFKSDGHNVREDVFFDARVRDALAGIPMRHNLRDAVARQATQLAAAGNIPLARRLLNWLPVRETAPERLELARNLADTAPAIAVQMLTKLTNQRETAIRLAAHRQLIEVAKERYPDLARASCDEIRSLSRRSVGARLALEELEVQPNMDYITRQTPTWPSIRVRPAESGDRKRGEQTLVRGPRSSSELRLFVESKGESLAQSAVADGMATIVGRSARFRQQLRIPVPASQAVSVSQMILTPTTLCVPGNFGSLRVFDLFTDPGVQDAKQLWSLPGKRDPAPHAFRRSPFRTFGPIAGDSVVYFTASRLFVTDARTGQTRWSRSVNLRGKRVFADADAVAIVDEQRGGMVELFSAFDGTLIRSEANDERPGDTAWMRDLRGRIFTREVRQIGRSGYELLRQEYGEDTPTWGHQYFDRPFLSDPIAGYFAVAERNGTIRIVEVRTGRVVAAASVNWSEKLEQTSDILMPQLLVTGDRFVVLVDRRSRREDKHVEEFLVGLDRLTGRRTWYRRQVDTKFIPDVGGLLWTGLPVAVLRSVSGQQTVLDLHSGKLLHDSQLSKEDRYRRIRAHVAPGENSVLLDFGDEKLSIEFESGPNMAPTESSPAAGTEPTTP